MPKKIKIFNSYQDVAAIEMDINDWLSKNPDAIILHVTQSETNTSQGWILVISILYESSNDT